MAKAKTPLDAGIRDGIKNRCLYSIATSYGKKPLNDYALYVEAWANRLAELPKCASYRGWALDILNDEELELEAKDEGLAALFTEAKTQGCWRDAP